MIPTSTLSPAAKPSIVPVTGPAQVGGLAFGDLSDFFNPFLHHFVLEALQGQGEVAISQEGSTVRGLLIYNFAERMGSIFTRDRAVAEALFAFRDSLAIFSDFPLSSKTETYHLYESKLPGISGAHRFAHPVRMAQESDRGAIARILRELYGRIDPSWLGASPRAGEKCFVANVGDEIAGVGWVSVVDGRGRLHSLSVRPRYRRMGIGTDLWHARALWALQAGAQNLISEISEHNAASLAIADRAGMQRVGRLILSYRPIPGSAPASG